MKLRFEQVLEYLESGEEDPQFEQVLAVQPDGARMLEEARLLHELLRRQAGQGPDDDAAVFEVLGAVETAPDYVAAESSAASYDMGDDLVDDDFHKISPKAVMAASRLGQRAAGGMRSIGALVIAIRKSDVMLSFDPAFTRARMRSAKWQIPPESKGKFAELSEISDSASRGKTDAPNMDLMFGQTPVDELSIRGEGIEITMPCRMTEPGPIRLQVRDFRLRIPARGLEIIFMPEAGPFTRFSTDSKGVAELPIPDQPGILRIEGRLPQLLRIRLEK